MKTSIITETILTLLILLSSHIAMGQGSTTPVEIEYSGFSQFNLVPGMGEVSLQPLKFTTTDGTELTNNEVKCKITKLTPNNYFKQTGATINQDQMTITLPETYNSAYKSNCTITYEIDNTQSPGYQLKDGATSFTIDLMFYDIILRGYKAGLAGTEKFDINPAVSGENLYFYEITQLSVNHTNYDDKDPKNNHLRIKYPDDSEYKYILKAQYSTPKTQEITFLIRNEELNITITKTIKAIIDQAKPSVIKYSTLDAEPETCTWDNDKADTLTTALKIYLWAHDDNTIANATSGLLYIKYMLLNPEDFDLFNTKLQNAINQNIQIPSYFTDSQGNSKGWTTYLDNKNKITKPPISLEEETTGDHYLVVYAQDYTENVKYEIQKIHIKNTISAKLNNYSPCSFVADEAMGITDIDSICIEVEKSIPEYVTGNSVDVKYMISTQNNITAITQTWKNIDQEKPYIKPIDENLDFNNDYYLYLGIAGFKTILCQKIHYMESAVVDIKDNPVELQYGMDINMALGRYIKKNDNGKPIISGNWTIGTMDTEQNLNTILSQQDVNTSFENVKITFTPDPSSRYPQAYFYNKNIKIATRKVYVDNSMLKDLTLICDETDIDIWPEGSIIAMDSVYLYDQDPNYTKGNLSSLITMESSDPSIVSIDEKNSGIFMTTYLTEGSAKISAKIKDTYDNKYTIVTSGTQTESPTFNVTVIMSADIEVDSDTLELEIFSFGETIKTGLRTYDGEEIRDISITQISGPYVDKFGKQELMPFGANNEEPPLVIWSHHNNELTLQGLENHCKHTGLYEIGFKPKKRNKTNQKLYVKIKWTVSFENFSKEDTLATTEKDGHCANMPAEIETGSVQSFIRSISPDNNKITLKDDNSKIWDAKWNEREGKLMFNIYTDYTDQSTYMPEGTNEYQIVFTDAEQENISEPMPMKAKMKIASNKLQLLYDDVVFISNTDNKFTEPYQWFINGQAQNNQDKQYMETNQNFNDMLQRGVSITTMVTIAETGEKVMTCAASSQAEMYGTVSKRAPSPSLSAYPNPAAAFSNITIKMLNIGDSGTGQYQIQIHNQMGVLVQTINDVQLSNTTALPSGIYTISLLYNGKAINYQKIIVE